MGREPENKFGLKIDIEKTKIKLRWKPPFNVDAAMSKAMKNKTL
jgi:hypothetical protein